MASSKSYIETDRQCRNLVEDASKGVFKPVYLLMGEEPYYTEMVFDAILSHALQEWERDFNETVCYGSDVDADAVITAARRFPMMAERQVVAVKDAQQMKGLEELSVYCQNPLDSTILVILMRGASADKRKALYKTVLKTGVIVESLPLRDYEVPKWISSYYSSRGLSLDPDACELLAESAGTDLSKIALETDKLLKNLPDGTKKITAADIERNIGISREFSIFELTRELSRRNAAKAVKIATRIGQGPRFAMPMATSALFTHFQKILKYSALLQSDPRAGQDKILAATGINSFFLREYDQAVRNYPLRSCLKIMSLLSDYDYKGKGGETGEAGPGELLVELTVKILNS